LPDLVLAWWLTVLLASGVWRLSVTTLSDTAEGSTLQALAKSTRYGLMAGTLDIAAAAMAIVMAGRITSMEVVATPGARRGQQERADRARCRARRWDRVGRAQCALDACAAARGDGGRGRPTGRRLAAARRGRSLRGWTEACPGRSHGARRAT